jgi:hypothetical protein
VNYFYDKNDVVNILANWWKEEKKLLNGTNGWYVIIGLRVPCVYLMVLICILYGDKICSIFLDAWVLLTYTMATIGGIFNWGDILSYQLGVMIERVHKTK